MKNTYHKIIALISSITLIPALALAYTADAVPDMSPPQAQQEMTDPVPVPNSDSRTIVDKAVEAGQFNTLAAALEAAGLTETLSGEGPFTVFAPTDEAFAALPEETLTALLQPQNRELLASILTYHVIQGKVLAEDVTSGEVPTIQGESLTTRVTETGVMVNTAQVVATDIIADNGVIHVIDSIILPPSMLSGD